MCLFTLSNYVSINGYDLYLIYFDIMVSIFMSKTDFYFYLLKVNLLRLVTLASKF